MIYVGTHDSIGLGEDGPTHQPVEMLEMLRAMPNMFVFRPADGNEVRGVIFKGLAGVCGCIYGGGGSNVLHAPTCLPRFLSR